jgi:3-methyladenine DNA glycosylase AlkC
MAKNKKENPNAFKHMISENLVSKMAAAIADVDKTFNKSRFLLAAKELGPLELKQRVILLRERLKSTLPQDYSMALDILLKSLKSKQLKGFDLWPYTEFIQTYGVNEPKTSLKALYELTSLFTSEFAVRPFLKNHSKMTLDFLEKCTQDSNVHVRRWASEGTRPRLPWGERLHSHIKNPELGIRLLEKLKYDDELYVRKSVANQLNDISKDNPDTVLDLLNQWQKNAPATHQVKIDWIIRHSLRSLIKAGHPKALQLIGANTKSKVSLSGFNLHGNNLKVKDTLEFEFLLQSNAKKVQKIIVDYAIHFVMANGNHSRKVFKLKTVNLAGGEKLLIKKCHPIRPITTRKYFSGTHKIDIQVNGNVLAEKKWTLKT